VPENGINAINHMSILLQKLQEYSSYLRKQNTDKFLGKPSLNVGLIVGGDNACSVPDICKIDIDRRIISSENYETFIDELEKICHGIQKEIPDFRYSISSPFLNIKPLDTSLNSPIMIAMKKASDDILGFHTIKAFPGSTDAPNYNCEAVICGPGSLQQCHSLNEYIDIEEIKNAVNIYISSIINLQNNLIS
jgi:acetylornithine deacetylase